MGRFTGRLLTGYALSLAVTRLASCGGDPPRIKPLSFATSYVRKRIMFDHVIVINLTKIFRMA
jgi:hypothetical protein